MLTDLTEPELRAYRSGQVDPPDFDEFWASTLTQSRAVAFPARVEHVHTGLTTLDVFDVTFPGFEGQPIRAWLRMPAARSADALPLVVQYVGYGGGRGLPTENLLWASAGFAHLQMDTRGQGSGWSVGATADAGATGPQIPGVMTRGIESRDTYYYRRLITDAVRAVEVGRELPGIDGARVAVMGGSQGGGLALAAAGLVPDLSAVIAWVPFLSDFPRAITIHDTDPYHELVRYLATHRDRVAQVMSTLSYVDTVNFGRRATAPAWFTVALMDEITKPSTVFGAYDAYAGLKQLEVFGFNGHEGGGPVSEAESIRILHEVFA